MIRLRARPQRLRDAAHPPRDRLQDGSIAGRDPRARQATVSPRQRTEELRRSVSRGSKNIISRASRVGGARGVTSRSPNATAPRRRPGAGERSQRRCGAALGHQPAAARAPCRRAPWRCRPQPPRTRCARKSSRTPAMRTRGAMRPSSTSNAVFDRRRRRRAVDRQRRAAGAHQPEIVHGTCLRFWSSAEERGLGAVWAGAASGGGPRSVASPCRRSGRSPARRAPQRRGARVRRAPLHSRCEAMKQRCRPQRRPHCSRRRAKTGTSAANGVAA